VRRLRVQSTQALIDRGIVLKVNPQLLQSLGGIKRHAQQGEPVPELRFDPECAQGHVAGLDKCSDAFAVPLEVKSGELN
jgi:hypothetical protein